MPPAPRPSDAQDVRTSPPRHRRKAVPRPGPRRSSWPDGDPAAIGDLFSADARYAYDPFGEAVVGRAAIVASWLADRDEPGSWQADYEVLAVDNDTFVAHGRTRYLTDDGAADGRCREYTEYYMRRRPDPSRPDRRSGAGIASRHAAQAERCRAGVRRGRTRGRRDGCRRTGRSLPRHREAAPAA